MFWVVKVSVVLGCLLLADGLSSVLSGLDTSFLRPFVEELLPHLEPSDLEIVELEDGNTNYCFKVIQRSTNENLLFLKHALSVTRRGNGEIAVDRLGYEAAGMSAFSKIVPSVVPKVRAFDKDINTMALDFIGEDFESLQKLLERGQGVDVDISRIVGTIMGRSHARSHEIFTTEEAITRYTGVWANQDAFELWRKHLYMPTIDMLKSKPPAEFEPQQVQTAIKGVESLLDIYLGRKEALIHGDLHCNNILCSADDGRRIEDRCRVVDFERCCLGPAGLDLGMFLSGLFFYYIGHSGPAVRRTLKEGVLATIEAYRASFRTQSPARPGQKQADIEGTIARILTDAVGFMALYPLFLLYTKPEINFLALENTPGYRWGDIQGRQDFVRKRHLNAILHAFELFLREREGSSSEAADVKQQRLVDGIVGVLEADDPVLLSGHQTEFWF